MQTATAPGLPDASHTLDVRAFINQRALSRNQWILVLLCFLIVAVDGMDVAIMGFVAPSIIQDWQISRLAFGLVMGAAPMGLAVGALLAGPSSDWWGRRKVLIGSVLVFGLCTLFTAWTRNTTEMAVLRFLTGLGLGAAMPNTTTLLSEYVPERRRAFLVAAMFTGFNLGSALVGFVAAALIPRFGWQSVLVLGGVLPLVLLPLLLVYLPESARFLVVRGTETAKVAGVLSRMCGASLQGVVKFVSGESEVKSRQPMAVLFLPEYRLRTLTLWVTYFMGLLVIYLTTSWLPTMMRDAGMSIDRAANVTAMFQLGGTVGALVVGWLMGRLNPNRVIAGAYVLGAVALVVMGLNGLNSLWVVAFVVAVGFFLSGAQTGLNGFAPSCYPTLARATGVSWMLGVGRLGSILGSSIGGVLMTMGWGFEGIFIALAVPAILAGGAILLNRRAGE
ncbi:AAHS family 4-hydroxybenzoate transporter-like MFS transporter [Acidovorax sp. 62]|uniref:MFS transporter n=1 Tax=Acidovorax sp. 62 TaxID=2035203 RepID=UPI000C194F3B|nr:aromatic acid/H+ symport family MFS transporter [Acidovorax sp. 62]PIF89171.1 AAHS family 4-hydroxybenzoate transporter-like MFS transporter [Acidovorax sp. 62]